MSKKKNKPTLKEVRESITKDDLRAIRFGDYAAIRDFDKIVAFNEEHARRHDNDPNYQCGDFSRDFYEHLAEDVDKSNWAVGFGYQRTKKHLEAQLGEPVKPSFTMLPIERGPEGETEEALYERIRQAVRDQFDLEQIAEAPVSETPDDHKPTETESE